MRHVVAPPAAALLARERAGQEPRRRGCRCRRGSSAATCPARPPRTPCDATARLVDDDLRVTLDYLGEDTLDADQADATVHAYLDAAHGRCPTRGLTRHAEVSVKLSAIGQALPQHGHKIALENARTICRAARNAGTTVTLDMEDHTTTDATLGDACASCARTSPRPGRSLQAYLHRTEADCRALAYEGSRVRLCKGAYDEPESVAFQGRTDVDQSYVRCLKVLLAGQGYPMIATHDPRMITIAVVARQPLRPRRRAATSSRCSTASGPTSSAGWPTPARPCASTSPTAPSGTATS